VYRFIPPSTLGQDEHQLDPEHIGILRRTGQARIVVGLDGSLETAPTPGDDALMGAVPVPAHLGGGFIFWNSDALYRARTFTGALEPIAPLTTNAIGVEFGPSSLLLFTPEGPPRAYALEPPGRRVPLSPHGALEIAAADAERALAFDATGRSLATIDGGRSWRDVTAELGEFTYGVREEGHEVAFVLGQNVGAWLERDGAFVRRPFPYNTAPQENKSLHLLKSAVSNGLPLPGAHALVLDGAGPWDVNLASGQVVPILAKRPYGNGCEPVSTEERGLFFCFDDAARDKTTTVISRALSEHPEVEKIFRGRPPFAIKGDMLVVGASCSGDRVNGVACARSPARATGSRERGQPSAWVEANIQAALGATWQLLYWVPKANGGVAAIVSEQKPSGPSPKAALIDAENGRVTPFDLPLDRAAPGGFARPIRNFVVLEDGTLRGFTNTSAFSVDATGHVSTSVRTFKRVRNAGAFALAEADDSRLWQTTDYGERWVEVARPPFEPELPPAESFRDVPRSFACSPVGCVLEHESGLGSWLRFGWPTDPPRAPAAPAQRTIPPLASPPPQTTPPRPKLRCVESSPPKPSGRPLLSLRDASGKSGTDDSGKSGAGSARKPSATVTMNVKYLDIFADAGEGFGLRAILHASAPRKAALEHAFEPFAATKAPFDVEFLEPFDPTGRTLKTTGSLAPWTGLLNERATNGQRSGLVFYPGVGSARPVLARAPAQADGVLLIDGDFSFWASHAGQIRPIHPGCLAESGYVDGRGGLFVACVNRVGATQIDDFGHARTVLSLPNAKRVRSRSHPGMSFFEPARRLLTNPDAIAVAPAEKLGILRLASGSEPATLDAPAWLLSADGAPVELAPWSSLELATSPACAKGDGYRALVQTEVPWIEVEGAKFSGREPGMSAIVRWSAERVCLEAVELGLRDQADGPSARVPMQVTIVARFTTKDSSAAFVGTGTTASVREAAKCELVTQ
jgi:hypothetical protein